MLALVTLAIRPAWGQETLVVDQSDNRGWVFYARPDINLPGEAPKVVTFCTDRRKENS
jgi:hypothetical protein